VFSPLAIRIRSTAFSAVSTRVPAVALLLVFGRAARASVSAATPDCSTSGGSFECSLLGVLHFLYAAAGVLTVVLIVVIAVAVHIYRRNKGSAEDDQ
jgi:hypothetical protein